MRAAVQVAADRHADHRGAGEAAVGAPAQGGQFVANLHHGRPDVIEELNLGHRLQPARGHADGAAHDGGFGQRRVEAALARRTRVCSPAVTLKTPPLPFTSREVFLAAAIGHVLAEHQDVGIAPHLLAQRGVEQVDHGLGRRRGIAARLRTAREVGSTVSE